MCWTKMSIQDLTDVRLNGKKPRFHKFLTKLNLRKLRISKLLDYININITNVNEVFREIHKSIQQLCSKFNPQKSSA